MRFEVFIPAENDEGFDVTLKLEAPNWMAALKSGLAKMGTGGADIRNVVCDIQPDNSILVSEPKSRRVFRITEAEESQVGEPPVAKPAAFEATQPDLAAEAAAARAAAEEAARRTAAEAARRAAAEEAARRAAAEAAARRQADEMARQAAEEERRRAEAGKHKSEELHRKVEEQRRKASDVQREAEKKEAARADVRILKETTTRADLAASQVMKRSALAAAETADELLAKVFEEMMDLQLSAPDINGAAEFAMNLAVRHIDAEAGAVLLADIDRGELYFAAAYGPKAREVKRYRIKMGQGLAGFSAREGFTLSLSDAARDPRHYKQIGEQVGYEAHSMLCAPMLFEGRSYGCMQLINRRQRAGFGPADSAALSYIATQLAEYLAPRVGSDVWRDAT
jgi:putative methionine-R-sulfoxide reductase with GAF domain